jgi:hypothetical protein
MPTTIELSHEKPGYVKHPVEARNGYWVLGLVEPNRKGLTPNGGIFEGNNYNDACKFCEEEAAARGISPEAYEATVTSSMFEQTFERALRVILIFKENKKKGGRVMETPSGFKVTMLSGSTLTGVEPKDKAAQIYCLVSVVGIHHEVLAEFIEKACENHEDLVSALTIARNQIAGTIGEGKVPAFVDEMLFRRKN